MEDQLDFNVDKTIEIVCYSPIMISTRGLWNDENPFNYAFPLLLMQLLLIMIATRLFVIVLRPIRQPRVICEMLGGILLGPSVLGQYQKFADTLFPLRSVIVLETMANVGLLYFMFLVGVGMDVSAIKRIGRKAITIGIAGMVLPFVIGAFFSYFLLKIKNEDTTKGAYILFLGVVLSVTAFPVLARILAELKLMNTEIGRVSLSAALVNDVVSWVLLTVSVSMVKERSPSLASFMVFLSTAAYVAFNFLVVRPVILWIVRKTPEGESFNDFYICLILAGVMISGLVTDSFGTHSIFGAFVFGLTIPNGPLGHTLVERVEDFISGLLLPLFFALSGLKTNLSLLTEITVWIVLILLVIVACVGKVLGTLAVTIFYQMSVTEGAVLGLLMNTKGLIEVVVLNVGKEHKILSEESFASMVLVTILMNGLIVPGISIIYKQQRGSISYKRRTIQMSKSDELRVLVCIYTPRNVPTIINLLQVSNPTKKSPICVYVLHLVELTGRTSALLIVHNARKLDHPAANRAQAQSDHILNAFENYEQQAEHISVQPLTAVSPYSTMHEDICNLAQDKRVALVIIPFHKQQTVDGEMEATNLSLRNVNRNVLANAPCSVGILVDRGISNFNHLDADQISHHVAVLFFGGPDDREALSYGWRMSENPGINLTVLRLVEGEEAINPSVHPDEPNVLRVETDKDTQKQLDEKLIHWFNIGNADKSSVVYVEKVVNNGEQTVAAIRTINIDLDLFIVGRGRGMKSSLTAGLTDWSECPELGAIGDLLASSDFAATASVLVMQQHVGEGLEGDGLETSNDTMLSNEGYVNPLTQ